MESAYPQFGGGNNARRKKNQDNFWEKDQPLAGHLNFQDFTNSEENVYTKNRTYFHKCIYTGGKFGKSPYYRSPIETGVPSKAITCFKMDWAHKA